LGNHYNRIIKKGGTFSRFSRSVAFLVGQPWAFGVACLSIVVWSTLGPVFQYTDTWQLIINTCTTIVTFLMVFLIQNTQNHDSQVLHLKLDELIRATKGAHTAVMDSEELTDEEILKIKAAYAKLAERGREKLRKGGKDTGNEDSGNLITKSFQTRPND
jgi:low affinity Fe/Cu permease